MTEKTKAQETGNRKQGARERPPASAPLSGVTLPVVVRSYQPADYPTLLRLWEEANLKPFTPIEIERLMGAGGSALVAVRHRATEAANAPDQDGSSAMPEEDVVGVILWSHNGSIGILWRLAVDVNARGLGIATRLLDRAEQEIHDLGLSGVSLLTRQTNEIARGIYTRRGYKWSDHLQFWGKRLPDPEENPAG